MDKANENQNILNSSYHSQNGYHQEHKQQMLVRIWGKKESIVGENVN
jgi:hypothetical protein